MDSITGKPKGMVSLTQFLQVCSTVGFRGDLKVLFFFFDSSCDGFIDFNEFTKWRELRQPMLDRGAPLCDPRLLVQANKGTALSRGTSRATSRSTSPVPKAFKPSRRGAGPPSGTWR